MTATPSNLIVMMDLDRCNFKNDLALELALSRTLLTIRKRLNAVPTVIWSGRGYHIIQVIDASGVNLESQQIFVELSDQPSRRFIQFAEELLSNGKSDKSHNNTVSFANCILRVPGSINSKNGQAVNLINCWNGHRSKINYLLSDFCVYLANEKAQGLRRRLTGQRQKQGRQSLSTFTRNGNTSYIFQWIERLLQTPIPDGRKYALWRILVPYLINRKHMSEQQSSNIIINWLASCDNFHDWDLTQSTLQNILSSVWENMDQFIQTK